MSLPTLTPFLLGSSVLLVKHHLYGRIRGKVKDIEAYVIEIGNLGVGTTLQYVEWFGLPNRHLELEWGSWLGTDGEFVLSAQDMEAY
jgi:hypothetical protein